MVYVKTFNLIQGSLGALHEYQLTGLEWLLRFTLLLFTVHIDLLYFVGSCCYFSYAGHFNLIEGSLGWVLYQGQQLTGLQWLLRL